MFKWFAALTETAPVVEEVLETVAVPAAEAASNALVALPLFTKGLLGVFLVLTLFFVTIKLMQKIGTEK